MSNIDIICGLKIAVFAGILYFLEVFANQYFGFYAQAGSREDTILFFGSIKYIKIFTLVIIIIAPISGVFNEFDFEKFKIKWLHMLVITGIVSILLFIIQN
jgi:hypothetical protein